MHKENYALYVVIGICLAGLLATIGFLFVQNRKLQNTALGNTTPSPTSSYVTITPTRYLDNETPTPSQKVEATNSAVVVFEAEGSFPTNDKSLIQARIIEPFLTYYSEEINDYVKTMTISPNTQANKAEFPYTAKYIFKDGVNGGFVITKKNGTIDWWYPECMGPCPFSESFKTKYPEIVKIAG